MPDMRLLDPQISLQSISSASYSPTSLSNRPSCTSERIAWTDDQSSSDELEGACTSDSPSNTSNECTATTFMASRTTSDALTWSSIHTTSPPELTASQTPTITLRDKTSLTHNAGSQSSLATRTADRMASLPMVDRLAKVPEGDLKATALGCAHDDGQRDKHALQFFNSHDWRLPSNDNANSGMVISSDIAVIAIARLDHTATELRSHAGESMNSAPSRMTRSSEQHPAPAIPESISNSEDTSTPCMNSLWQGDDPIEQVYDSKQSLSHALVCQRVGVYIIPKTWADLWLVNDLGLYITAPFLRRLFSNNEYQFRLQKNIDQAMALRSPLLTSRHHSYSIFSIVIWPNRETTLGCLTGCPY